MDAETLSAKNTHFNCYKYEFSCFFIKITHWFETKCQNIRSFHWALQYKCTLTDTLLSINQTTILTRIESNSLFLITDRLLE